MQNGGSLELWAKYFDRATAIVGCDIDPRCSALHFDDPRIRVVVANANSAEAMERIQGISDRYEIIIDDGSHHPNDVIAGFLNYFPLVAPGGFHFAEDLHVDYLASDYGGILQPLTSSRFFFLLTQLMHRAYWERDLPPETLARPFIAPGHFPRFVDEGWIESITFHDSLVAVKRADAPGAGQLGARLIVGEDAAVNPEPLRFRQD